MSWKLWVFCYVVALLEISWINKNMKEFFLGKMFSSLLNRCSSNFISDTFFTIYLFPMHPLTHLDISHFCSRMDILSATHFHRVFSVLLTEVTLMTFSYYIFKV